MKACPTASVTCGGTWQDTACIRLYLRGGKSQSVANCPNRQVHAMLDVWWNGRAWPVAGGLDGRKPAREERRSPPCLLAIFPKKSGDTCIHILKTDKKRGREREKGERERGREGGGWSRGYCLSPTSYLSPTDETFLSTVTGSPRQGGSSEAGARLRSGWGARGPNRFCATCWVSPLTCAVTVDSLVRAGGERCLLLWWGRGGTSNGLRYLRWGGDGEAVQPEKG